jgi:phenylalanyl-tRNA synthetase beta chain
MNGQHLERVNLAMLAPSEGDGLRAMRGAIDRVVQIVHGRDVIVQAEPQQAMPWFAPGAVLRIGDEALGVCGLLAARVTKQFGLHEPIVAAEIGLPQHYHRYPPPTEAHALPAFPPIERDVSAIVDDQTLWRDVHAAVSGLALQHAEAVEFVTTFRGKQIGLGKKSLTLRVRFRAADRTLRHEEVDPQMQRVMELLKSNFRAEIRA